MATSDFQPLQGMSDLVTPEISLWQTVEERARRVFELYGHSEIRTPILERTDVFVRSMGDTTEVVQKEMYSFEDRGGRNIALRPEGTAGVMRYIAGGGPEARQARLYYMGPMFRAERPQAGRKRQFHQIGAESLGEPNPAADAECIAMQAHLLAEWGLEDFRIRINTRGLPEDRAAVAEGLREALKADKERLCEDCRRRFDVNVLRILDCKEESCAAIAAALPPVTSFMCEESRRYFDEVVGMLKTLEIDVEVNPRLVRGLDYYVHTVWEITHGSLGAQDSISGGGRYRIDIGDTQIDGVGFAVGVERVISCIMAERAQPEDEALAGSVWIVTAHAKAFEENLVLAMMLRRHGIRCGMDLSGRSMKAQMRAAGRAGAAYVVIRGDAELENGTFVFKDMAKGTQEDVEMPELMRRVLPGGAPGRSD